MTLKFGNIIIYYYICISKQQYIMRAILGNFYYAPHRTQWGVWQWDWVSENGASGKFIKDFRSKEEARAFVWENNGWGTPKTKMN